MHGYAGARKGSEMQKRITADVNLVGCLFRTTTGQHHPHPPNVVRCDFRLVDRHSDAMADKLQLGRGQFLVL